MSWVWDQSKGEMHRNGQLISRGYSGKGRGRNNPALQGVQGIGPIPRGRWLMMGIYDSANVGPRTITLWRVGDDKFDDFDQLTGRGAFRIHGDSIRAPGTASKGCIILPRAIREAMWSSGDCALEVVE
jgi:hypothetical protein